MTALDIQQTHQRDGLRHAARRKAGHRGHVAGTPVENQRTGGEAQVVGIGGVEQRRRTTAPFVAAEVALRGEGNLRPGRLDGLGGHVDQQLLGRDQRDLQVAVRITVGEQHLDDVVRQGGKQRRTAGRKQAAHEHHAGSLGLGFAFGSVFRQHIVEFSDQLAHFRDEFDQPLGNQHDPVVDALVRTGNHRLRDLCDDFTERLPLGSHLFGNDGEGRLRLQGNFQRDVRGRTPHEFHEVPVFERGAGVLQDIASEFAIDLGRRIKTEGDRQQFANLQITIDGFRHADHLHAGAIGLDALEQIFGQDGGVGVGIVTTDDHDGIEIVFDAGFTYLGELLVALDLGAVAAEKIEAAGIDDAPDIGLGDLEKVARQQPLRATPDTQQGIAITKDPLDAADNIMPAGRRATGEQDGDALALILAWIGARRLQYRAPGRLAGQRKGRSDALFVARFRDIAPGRKSDRRKPAGACKGGAHRQRQFAHGLLEKGVVRLAALKLIFFKIHGVP